MEDLTLAILVGLALAAVRLRDLLGATAVLGAYSLMMAVLWAQMNALDVGFTEAAVGAGISTVLLLAALERIGRRENRQPQGRCAKRTLWGGPKKTARAVALERTLAMGVCAAVAGMLLYGLGDMPRVGDPSSPAYTHPQVAKRYIEQSPNNPETGEMGEVGPANIVTAVLGDYRGYDTMGETVVIFTAALCVLLLLRPERRRRDGDGPA